MTERKSAEALLRDIVVWGERAADFCRGMTEEQFLDSLLVQAAVARCIEVIGEAARNVVRADPAIAEANPDFEFRRAYATRNILIHDYGDVQQEIVWRTVTKSIPEIVAVARRILDSRRSQSS